MDRHTTVVHTPDLLAAGDPGRHEQPAPAAPPR